MISASTICGVASAQLEHNYTIRGLYSLFGPFRDDGFLHESVAALAAERGLSHSPAAALAAATNKFDARYCLGAAGVPDVPFGLADDKASLIAVARSISYPVVLKPLTGVGSSLIFRCRNDAETRKAWHHAKRQLPRAHYAQLRMAAHTVITPQGVVFTFDPARTMLVERYLPGREASVECMVVGENVMPLVVHDKLDVEEVTGRCSSICWSLPRCVSRHPRSKAARHAAASIRALGLRNMFCHVELRWVDGHGPRILEVNPRVGAVASPTASRHSQTFGTRRPVSPSSSASGRSEFAGAPRADTPWCFCSHQIAARSAGSMDRSGK